MIQYLIILTDYKAKESKIIDFNTNKYECINVMENYILEYLTEKQGYKTLNIINEPSGLHSSKWNNFDYGYIVTRNCKRIIDKYTIFLKKELKGYIYNSFEIEPVFSIELIKQYAFKKYFTPEDKQIIRYEMYDNVIAELKNKFNEI